MKIKNIAILSTLGLFLTGIVSEAISNYDINTDDSINILDSIHIKSNILNGDTQYTTQDYLNIKKYILMGEELPNNNIDIDISCILEPKGTIHTGEGTYYGGGYVGGCAMLDPVDSNLYVCAMNITDYNNAMLAGAYIEVTSYNGSVKMLVTDLLPEGKKGDIDLNEDAFPLIANKIDGRVDISWKIIPLETDEPVSFRFKEGSTQYWCGVQVLNHRYPITKLEYLDSSGEFITLPREQYNYFISSDMGAGPFTFRITDIYGQIIIEEDIALQLDDSVIVQGKNQFPI